MSARGERGGGVGGIGGGGVVEHKHSIQLLKKDLNKINPKQNTAADLCGAVIHYANEAGQSV